MGTQTSFFFLNIEPTKTGFTGESHSVKMSGYFTLDDTWVSDDQTPIRPPHTTDSNSKKIRRHLSSQRHLPEETCTACLRIAAKPLERTKKCAGVLLKALTISSLTDQSEDSSSTSRTVRMPFLASPCLVPHARELHEKKKVQSECTL